MITVITLGVGWKLMMPCILLGVIFSHFQSVFHVGEKVCDFLGVHTYQYIPHGILGLRKADFFCQCFLLFPLHDPEFLQFW